MSNPLFNMDKQVKDLIISYLEWEKNQPKDHYEIDAGEYKIVIDGVEVNIPEEEDIIASLEEEAAKLEVTVDYYMQEFLWPKRKNSFLHNNKCLTCSIFWRVISMSNIWISNLLLFIMSSKDSYLYVLDYWVPFPASEYGGLVVLIAENDQDAFDILSNEEQLESDYGHLIMEQIVKSTKLKLAEEHESGIIDVFCT